MSKIKKPRRSRRPLLVSDSFRALVGSVVLLASIVGAVVVGQADTSSRSVIFQLITLGWSAFAVTTIVLIWLGFRKRSHTQLRRAVVHEPRARWLEAMLGMGGPTMWVVSVSLMALFVTLMSLMQESNDLVSQVVAALCAVLSWVLVVFVQALAYARLHLVGNVRGIELRGNSSGGSGLRFLQPEPTVFFDYLAMSFAVQASFTYPAVEVSGRRARNLVIQHQVVGFVFNTIIIAVLVALLLANVGS